MKIENIIYNKAFKVMESERVYLNEIKTKFNLNQKVELIDICETNIYRGENFINMLNKYSNNINFEIEACPSPISRGLKTEISPILAEIIIAKVIQYIEISKYILKELDESVEEDINIDYEPKIDVNDCSDDNIYSAICEYADALTHEELQSEIQKAQEIYRYCEYTHYITLNCYNYLKRQNIEKQNLDRGGVLKFVKSFFKPKKSLPNITGEFSISGGFSQAYQDFTLFSAIYSAVKMYDNAWIRYKYDNNMM